MIGSGGRGSAAPRRSWIPEAGLWFATAVLVTVVFAYTPLDIAAARIFYHAQDTDHWPLGKVWPWWVLYHLAPVITASLVVIGLTAILMGKLPEREAWRQNGIRLIFCIVIGPGLMINAVFKDHWNRPRPREVAEFGGTLHYTPAPWRGEGGSSFPCGHCSVGFLYATGWWAWKRRRPGWARVSLALGLIVGSALGLGRMAAGGHFLSDVIWSALIALGLAHIVYEHLLPVGEPDGAAQNPPRARPQWLRGTQCLTIFALLGAAFVLLALFVTPHGKPFSTQLDLALLPSQPRVLEVGAPAGNIDIVIEDSSQRPQLRADGELHGFGLPGSQLDASLVFHALPTPTLSFRIEEQGWITDLSAFATIRVPLGELQRIVVRLQQGNIHVTDTTRRRVVHNGPLRLDLHTDSGRVLLTESDPANNARGSF